MTGIHCKIKNIVYRTDWFIKNSKNVQISFRTSPTLLMVSHLPACEGQWWLIYRQVWHHRIHPEGSSFLSPRLDGIFYHWLHTPQTHPVNKEIRVECVVANIETNSHYSCSTRYTALNVVFATVFIVMVKLLDSKLVFHLLRLTMEHHKRFSINVPPNSEDCLSFELWVKVRSPQSQRELARFSLNSS